VLPKRVERTHEDVCLLILAGEAYQIHLLEAHMRRRCVSNRIGFRSSGSQ
jgi:hypothetical protein